MAQLSTRFIRECISSNLPVCYYSEDGHYFGSIDSFERIDPIRQKLQIYLTDDSDFCLEMARCIIDAKIRNSLTLLESLQGVCQLSDDDTQGLRHSLKSLRYAESIDMVNGFEGHAAKCYFACLAKAIVPEDLRFAGRSTRPPKDPFNSMLSFGYSVLYRNIIGAIERHGLHPYFAFIHKSKYGHAALASDLMEDLRAPVIDRIVVEFVNSGEIGVEDFELKDSGAIYMGRGTMRRLTGIITQSMVKGQPFFIAYGDNKNYGFQVMLDKRMQSLVGAIEKGDASLYKPFVWEPL